LEMETGDKMFAGIYRLFIYKRHKCIGLVGKEGIKI